LATGERPGNNGQLWVSSSGGGSVTCKYISADRTCGVRGKVRKTVSP